MENEKIELKQNFINEQPGALKAIVKYCKENINSMDINDETDYYLCKVSTLYLMKMKIGHFDKDEARCLTVYFAKLGLKMYSVAHGIEAKVNIDILPAEEYKKLRGEKSNAACILHNDNSYTLIYSEEKVCQRLMTNDPDEFLRAMQTICHEVAHVYQEIRVQRDYRDVNAIQAKRGYLMALEDITRKVYPKFYTENYAKLFKENDAEEMGLSMALDVLKMYNKGVYELFDKEEIKTRIEQYRKMSKEEKNILGKKSPTLQTMEFIAQNAHGFRKLYPILGVAYHEDGPRKTITELLDDRAERIAKGEPSIDNANELLLEILNSRGTTPEERREEIEELDKYIVSRGIEDEFVYELLSSRLQRYGIKEAAIQEYIKMTKAQVKEKKEAEGINKDSEAAEWMETMKGFNDRANEIEGHSKKQADIVQAISTEQRQKNVDEKVVEDTNDVEK